MPVPTSDDLIGLLLVTIWAMRTGRRPPEPPYQQRSSQELETFWQDPEMAVRRSGHP